jgi:hypothetical protein
MYTITKRPIFILSAPRTGSTILGKYIKEICEDPKMKYFNEPESAAKNKLDNLQGYMCRSNNYIVKTHLTNLHKYPPYLKNFFKTSESVFRIRIQRRIFLDQVTSLYIAVKRNNKWHYETAIETNFVPDTIEIDKDLLDRQIRHIYRCNKALKNSQINFDLNLYYEDLPVMDNLDLYKTPKPLNYQEIRDITTVMMAELRARYL